MMEDKKTNEKLDNTIEEFYKVLEKHKNDNEELQEAYERISRLKDKRKTQNNSNL